MEMGCYLPAGHEEDEPHIIFCKSLGHVKGRIETYYYGEAQTPIKPIKEFS
jgi:hypothetical protein|tara:strand:+ start:193 stop:345 length:153 start_codon:yes stop_codon:yes gene_type:complete